MTKEEWEKRQSVVRRVQDEETGRYRLIYLSEIYVEKDILLIKFILLSFKEYYAVSQFCIFSRLIKGDGEVLEEIVSRDRHKQINKQATMADGDFFQSHTVDKQRIK